MQIHDTHASSKRPAVSSRWLGRSLVAGSLVATSLAVAACGSEKKVTVLNTEKVERAIERSTLAQRNKHVVVSCPSGVHQKQGVAFSCMAVGKTSRTSFAVTQTNGAGQVHYQAQ
ncbi:MAG: hypothetical protein QOI52_1944 [Chloroflexota bacterium]|nr:hypothetical protein [Chloroflexota bacterium]